MNKKCSECINKFELIFNKWRSKPKIFDCGYMGKIIGKPIDSRIPYCNIFYPRLESFLRRYVIMYKIKKTKKLIKKLQPYWKEYNKISEEFRKKMCELELRMEKETGIEGIELFWCDNECVGIGNVMRDMQLIRGRELEYGDIINYE